MTLPPLTREEVALLTQRYGLRLTAEELKRLYTLTGGHPYLVRRALFSAALAGGTPGTLPLDPDSEVFQAHLRELRHFVEREGAGSAAQGGAARLQHPRASGPGGPAEEGLAGAQDSGRRAGAHLHHAHPDVVVRRAVAPGP